MMSLNTNVWPHLGTVNLNENADRVAQEIILYSHFSDGISQELILSSRLPCSCSSSQLHGMGDHCESCKSRRDLNRVTEQFCQHKKLHDKGY